MNELTGLQRTDTLLILISMLITGNAVMSVINAIITKKIQISGELLADGFELHVGRHIMHMDFEKLEDAKILDLKEKAVFNIRLHDALRGGPNAILNLFQRLFTISGTAVIITMLNPMLAAVLIALILLNTLIYKRIQTTKFKFYKDVAVFNRQGMYYRDLSHKVANAKDVRVYNMSDYILSRIDYYNDAVNNVFYKMFLKQRKF